ncbi:cell division protein FtsX [Caviibacter abscessus]|uniref:cell division protein FtsX n=1 Tax=Caviibacter abscessus TaxID=1766719 RepID=UPI000834F65B|nr:permease-like cell division protein FtsX [Caviibacter abscessus]
MNNHKFSVKKLLVDKSIVFSSVITLIIIFILTYTFSFGLLSLKSYSTKYEDSNQIIAYLNDLSEENKIELNKKILEVPGVASIRYESKEVALKISAKELGVELSNEENPLNDVFYIYLKNDVNINKLKDSLTKMSEIKEIDFRTKAIESSMAFNKNIRTLTYNVTIVLALFGALMIYNIVGFSVKSRRRVIHANLLSKVDPQSLKIAFFMESVITTIIATVLSFGIYIILKKFLIESITILIPAYTASIFLVTEIEIAIAIAVITIIIALIINFLMMNKYYKMSYYETEKEKMDELIESTVEENIENTDENIEDIDLELGVEDEEIKE